MVTKHQKIKIDLSSKYSDAEKTAIAEDIIDFIIDRTQLKNLDRNNARFKKYSEIYINSQKFKAAGKSINDFNLTLDEDMLSAMKTLDIESDGVVIGFEKGTPENAKADGNIRGTYGKDKSTGKGRDFLGITKKDLKTILSDYPLRTTKKGKTAEDVRLRTEERREGKEGRSSLAEVP